MTGLHRGIYFILLIVFFSGCDFAAYEKVCQPFSGLCTSDGKIEVCKSDGSGYVTESCPDGTICSGGKCTSSSSSTLSILTQSLPSGENALPYETQLSAEGGMAPYSWQLLDGSLPEGFSLSSDGTISGYTSDAGTFDLTFRVFDSSQIPQYATEDFTLEIDISPLEIVAENFYDAVVTKVILLDFLIPYMEYSVSLEAAGGLTPYQWAELTPPSMLSSYISNWGLPAEFEMTSEGHISGTASNLDDATTITLPNGTTVTGYFIYAGVTDSQSPSATASAVFAIPTIPVK
ncbi:MAG: hypothetical protein JXR95_15880 [Deltaproteobacteria bacterium]|nr:hypothetical protein [Deltaproteobacteria bacterium]